MSTAPPNREARPAARRRAAAALLAPAVFVLAALLVLPLALIVWNSLVHGAPGAVGGWPPTLANYVEVLGDGRNLRILGRTMVLAAAATVLAAAASYPIALVIVSTRSRSLRAAYTIAALSPLLISVVLRTFGWQVLLGSGGPAADLLTELFGPRWLLGLVGTKIATVIGLTHMLMPFVLLGLLPALDRIDPNVIRAAETLGASRLRVFWRVVLPLSRPGLVAGALIGFALGCTAYVTPALLGGRQNEVFSALVYHSNFVSFDWNAGAALSIILLAVVVASAAAIGRFGRWPPPSRPPARTARRPAAARSVPADVVAAGTGTGR